MARTSSKSYSKGAKEGKRRKHGDADPEATSTQIVLPSNTAAEIGDEESGDDQTAALWMGLHSSSDASNDEASDGADKIAARFDLSTLPDPNTATRQSSAAKSLGATSVIASSERSTDEPVVLYISRIPHGFYEHQMLSYFSQFGEIVRLRLARNRRTGASKHFAFIEFAHPEVAKIVQQTMNNYLMFKHILKVELVPKQMVHPDLWKGAGKRFRPVPWNRIEKTRVSATDRAGWDKRVKREDSRRMDKRKALQALGYDFAAPTLKDVPKLPQLLANKTEN